jgi:flagellar basal-body rod modification protein FlgD
MEVSGVQNGTAQQADRSKLNQDFDQFLLLLTTQLQNQDPLAPMDTSEFTSQLVQFSGVEQQIKGNTLLQNLLSAQTLNMTALGVSFIGKNVEVAGKDFRTDGTSPSSISYEMPQTATAGTITIVDKDGNTVFSKPAELTRGLHGFTWDGKGTDGQSVPEGDYTVSVSALTETGLSLNVTTYVPGYVNGLETAEDGSLVLDIGNQKVPLADVRKISMAAAS